MYEQTHKDIVVIGASAGGVGALRTLVGGLPQEFPGSIFVVLHAAASSPAILATILERSGKLPAVTVRAREPIRKGTIYVAAPDRHLLVEENRVLTTMGPKENCFRPAVDPLFRSAAATFGKRVIGVILSGGLDDGMAGLWAVKRLGGTAIVQDPATALCPSMPTNALAHVEVDHCVPVGEIAQILVRLTREPQVASEG